MLVSPRRSRPLDQGDLGQLRSRCDEYAEVVDRLDDPRERSQLATARSTIAFIEGRYPDAATLADQALDEGQASGDFNAALVHYAQGILRAVDLGQAKEVLPLLIEATEYQNIVGFAAGTALCAALAGDHDRAREALNRFAGSGFEGLPRGADWLAPTAFLAHVCAIVGAREHASGLYSTLSNQPSTCVRVGPLIGWWGPVDHHLGSLCLLMGRLDDAERHLQEALNLEERIGARPFAARTLGVLSATERARSSAHGGERVDSLLDQALALTVELESPGIADEIRST